MLRKMLSQLLRKYINRAIPTIITVEQQMKILLVTTLIPILIIIGVESSGSTNTNALNNNNNSSNDFAAVETLGKSYSFGLDYTVFLNKTQIVKSEIADDEVINASRRTPVRGAFYSSDRDTIEDFDAFLIKEHRIKVNFVNGTIEFINQHHLINLECNFNSTDKGCQTFYGEFPYREQPTQYVLVLAAYFDDYVKYYFTRVNLS